MKQLYKTTLLVMLSCGLFLSCGGDDSDDNCANYAGPALSKGVNDSCYYIDQDGIRRSYSDPEFCKCAK